MNEEESSQDYIKKVFSISLIQSVLKMGNSLEGTPLETIGIMDNINHMHDRVISNLEELSKEDIISAAKEATSDLLIKITE